MILKYKSQYLFFSQVELLFSNRIYANIFADKNNKTLLETIDSTRYKKFKSEVMDNYQEFLDWPLGKFILKLKNDQDNFYLRFLNKYGDETYCQFRIEDKIFNNKKGLYIYYIDSDLKYIGRSLDHFKKRINYGYGKIHPKNCYIDGQATNCHLNNLITQVKDCIKFAVYPLIQNDEIKIMEKELIIKYTPEWNLQF